MGQRRPIANRLFFECAEVVLSQHGHVWLTMIDRWGKILPTAASATLAGAYGSWSRLYRWLPKVVAPALQSNQGTPGDVRHRFRPSLNAIRGDFEYDSFGQ